MNHNNIEYNISNHQNLEGVDTKLRVNLWTFLKNLWRTPRHRTIVQ